jgi:hypothetical protein
MASVTVFVDDAVRAELPRICTKDGVPTGDALSLSQEVGNRAGLGIAWLLIFAGPLGWFALLLISLSRSGRVESLRVEIPMSDTAYRRRRQAQTQRDRAAVLLIASVIGGMLLLISPDSSLMGRAWALLVITVFALSLIAMAVGAVRFGREDVGISLDASRRWVTLSNVHPHFAQACEAQQASRPHRT